MVEAEFRDMIRTAIPSIVGPLGDRYSAVRYAAVPALTSLAAHCETKTAVVST